MLNGPKKNVAMVTHFHPFIDKNQANHLSLHDTWKNHEKKFATDFSRPKTVCWLCRNTQLFIDPTVWRWISYHITGWSVNCLWTTLSGHALLEGQVHKGLSKVLKSLLSCITLWVEGICQHYSSLSILAVNAQEVLAHFFLILTAVGVNLRDILPSVSHHLYWKFCECNKCCKLFCTGIDLHSLPAAGGGRASFFSQAHISVCVQQMLLLSVFNIWRRRGHFYGAKPWNMHF